MLVSDPQQMIEARAARSVIVFGCPKLRGTTNSVEIVANQRVVGIPCQCCCEAIAIISDRDFQKSPAPVDLHRNKSACASIVIEHVLTHFRNRGGDIEGIILRVLETAP